MLRILIKEIIEDLKTNKIKLNVFDFDGTIFNSPSPPEDWKKSYNSWYYDPISLSQDLIGDGSDYWNMDVVYKAVDCLNNKNSITILLTGRGAKKFETIINDLLLKAGLNFDYVKLNPSMRTNIFKINEIKNILEKNDSIKTIEFWDDNEKYLEEYKNIFANLGYNVIINKI